MEKKLFIRRAQLAQLKYKKLNPERALVEIANQLSKEEQTLEKLRKRLADVYDPLQRTKNEKRQLEWSCSIQKLRVDDALEIEEQSQKLLGIRNQRLTDVENRRKKVKLWDIVFVEKNFKKAQEELNIASDKHKQACAKNKKEAARYSNLQELVASKEKEVQHLFDHYQIINDELKAIECSIRDKKEILKLIDININLSMTLTERAIRDLEVLIAEFHQRNVNHEPDTLERSDYEFNEDSDIELDP